MHTALSHGLTHALLTITFSWLGLSPGAIASQADDSDLRNRFHADASRITAVIDRLEFRAVSRMEQEYTTTDDSFRKTLKQRYGKGGQPEVESFETTVSGQMVKEVGNTNGVEYVMARNPEYAFRITRNAKVNRYAINWLEEYGVDAQKDEFIAKESRQPLAFPLATGYPFGMSMAELLESPHFSIKEISNYEGGQHLVRIAFEYVPDDERQHLTNAYMICDPNLHWAVTETQSTLWGGATLHTVIEFGDVVNGFPLAKTLRSTNAADDPDVTLQRTITVEVLDPNDITESEFYLSHYGLPEPKFERPWYGTWLIYLLGGIVCLAGAYALRRRNRASI